MLITLSVRRIVEEKSDDDEIPNYIKVQNTFTATQGISSNPEVITKIAFTSQSKSISSFCFRFCDVRNSLKTLENVLNKL